MLESLSMWSCKMFAKPFDDMQLLANFNLQHEIIPRHNAYFLKFWSMSTDLETSNKEFVETKWSILLFVNFPFHHLILLEWRYTHIHYWWMPCIPAWNSQSNHAHFWGACRTHEPHEQHAWFHILLSPSMNIMEVWLSLIQGD